MFEIAEKEEPAVETTEVNEDSKVPTKDKEKTVDEQPKATSELFDEIEPVEGDERGKFSLKVGDSTYWGETEKEVIKNLVKGKAEQDAYIRKVKASEKVRVPQREDDVPEAELPSEQDIYVKHIESLTRANKVDVNMLRWGREDWNKYQDENGLRDYEISEARQTLRDLVKQANDLTARDMRTANTAFVNKYTLDKETDAVSELLAESGLSPEQQEKFDYDAVLEAVTKKIGKNGEIPPGLITAEAGKQITRIMRDGTPVKKDLAEEAKKGKEAKEKVKSPGNGDKPTKLDNVFHTYDQIARAEKRQLEKMGREI